MELKSELWVTVLMKYLDMSKGFEVKVGPHILLYVAKCLLKRAIMVGHRHVGQGGQFFSYPRFESALKDQLST